MHINERQQTLVVIGACVAAIMGIALAVVLATGLWNGSKKSLAAKSASEARPRWVLVEREDPFDKTYTCYVGDAEKGGISFMHYEPSRDRLVYFFPAPDSFYTEFPYAREWARNTCLADYAKDGDAMKAHCYSGSSYTMRQTNLIGEAREEDRLYTSDAGVARRDVALSVDLTDEEAKKTEYLYVRYRVELTGPSLGTLDKSKRITDGGIEISELTLGSKLARECSARKAARKAE